MVSSLRDRRGCSRFALESSSPCRHSPCADGPGGFRDRGCVCTKLSDVRRRIIRGCRVVVDSIGGDDAPVVDREHSCRFTQARVGSADHADGINGGYPGSNRFVDYVLDGARCLSGPFVLIEASEGQRALQPPAWLDISGKTLLGIAHYEGFVVEDQFVWLVPGPAERQDTAE